MLKTEAIQKTALVNAVWDVVRTHLSGVLPFPDGEDAFFFKAVYFKFDPFDMKIGNGIDAKIVVDDSLITLYMNRSCEPNGILTNIMQETITPENPFARAIVNVLNTVTEEIQKNGKDWCRIGNYRSLVIRSPFIERLKAFCMVNPDLVLPLVASMQVNAVRDDSPEIAKTLEVINGEPLPKEKVSKINAEMPEGSVKPRVRKVAPEKPISDRQKRNKLNKLLNVGIGGGKDKPVINNPRVRKR